MKVLQFCIMHHVCPVFILTTSSRFLQSSDPTIWDEISAKLLAKFSAKLLTKIQDPCPDTTAHLLGKERYLCIYMSTYACTNLR